jgi:hypothetical protein
MENLLAAATIAAEHSWCRVELPPVVMYHAREADSHE